MMKVLMINGSPNKMGCTFTALSEVAGALGKRGIASEIFWIGKKAIQGCAACWGCMKLGRCVFGDDGVNELNARAGEFDAMVIGSPVYYGGPAGGLCAFLDRFFLSGGAEKWAGKLGACVVSCRRGGASAAFDRLNKYFTICNMPVVSSQYWNQVHGNSPEQVMQDLEGLQTMRTLGENMGYLLECIEAGRKAGVPEPDIEETVYTNFIR